MKTPRGHPAVVGAVRGGSNVRHRGQLVVALRELVCVGLAYNGERFVKESYSLRGRIAAVYFASEYQEAGLGLGVLKGFGREFHHGLHHHLGHEILAEGNQRSGALEQ